MVAAGATYAEAASALGLSRNAVAGACHRVGLKVGRRRSRNPDIEKARVAAIRAWWASRKHRVHHVQTAADIASIASSIASSKSAKA